LSFFPSRSIQPSRPSVGRHTEELHWVRQSRTQTITTTQWTMTATTTTVTKNDSHNNVVVIIYPVAVIVLVYGSQKLGSKQAHHATTQ